MVHSVQSVNSRAQHVFSLTPQAHIQRSSFNRSHGNKTTFNEGELIPIFVDEVLPGDTFNLSLTALCRMATPIFPIMDNLYFETHFFFVPCRLVWENWQEFNGEQNNPTDSTDFLIPTVSGVFSANSLFDYMSIPTSTGSALTVNALPFRAYNLIYNQWYRDENLQTSVVVNAGDGPDSPTDYAVLVRGKRHDYFTSCLPWPQKINDGTVVEIPLGLSAPITTSSTSLSSSYFPASKLQWARQDTGAITGANTTLGIDSLANTVNYSSAVPGGILTDSVPANLVADLSTATAATINQLRQAFQLQVLFERDARGGTRYTEIIRSHFNVISPDMRLQRPEYLGGGSQMINVAPVAQTAPSVSGETPQGNLAAFAVGHVQGHGFTKSFTEHGYILGIASVRADLNYQQGINRLFSRSTRYDFYWPALAHIGEQAVLNQEIFADGSSNDQQVFGYQERYAEYRYKPSVISGLFRSNATGTLDAWHLAQQFAALPALNSSFIQEKAPMPRILAVTDQPHFIADMFFDLKCARPMPLYGDPMQLGRF